MSVPALGRASLLPGPSSRVHHFTVITIILVATVVASSQPKDQCQQDSANFASQIHTIGSIDDALWAITKPDWQVYKLTPCNPANDSLVHCMMVDSPVEVDTKWPKLSESVKSAAQATDFTFPVDNSVVMDSSQFGNTVLAMHGNSFQNYSYFGFNFGTSEHVYTFEQGTMFNGTWISSSEKDEAFRLVDFGKKVEQIYFGKLGEKLVIQPNGSQKSICKIGSNDDLQVQFKVSDCSPDGADMVWSVSKGVLYRKQFYLFASDTVYIFSDQAETGSTKMKTVALADFFHCFEPTTSAPPSSTRNATNPRITTNSTHISTTAKSSSTTIIIIGVVVIGLVVILALITAYFCWCRTKASKDGKSDGNAILGSSSPNDSKVSVKVQAVSKGALKQSQTKAKAVAPNTSLGKQSPKPKASSSARILIKVDTDAIERKLAERRELSRELAQIGKRMAKAKESTVPNSPHF